MRLSDLKIVGKNSPLDISRTRSLRNRLQAFLEAAQTAEPPTNFENPNEGERHMELDIFVPKPDGDDSLQLPLENLSTDESSDSSSESDSEAAEKQISGHLVEEINPSENLLGDDGERGIGYDEEEISDIDSCLILHPCSFESALGSVNGSDGDDDQTDDVPSTNEAGADQASPIIFVDDNRSSYCNPRLAALMNALTSPEFAVSEIPKTHKRSLIEEISSPAKLSSEKDGFTVPKRLKIDNDD
ncbi:unnamed protein product [Hymenolepis diminuta]|uniref:Uncharacterized protein n=1 Tax=Hymenolepis diminuta TaxID=6216 RepID=A0A0R3SFL2_HYMDI|nr:unnamed protein product [Hymenolepis diminuta]VUZ39054.1 unnamed protein product [Hymenolepis diminuta]